MNMAQSDRTPLGMREVCMVLGMTVDDNEKRGEKKQKMMVVGVENRPWLPRRLAISKS
jgi:hypothetical protein